MPRFRLAPLLLSAALLSCDSSEGQLVITYTADGDGIQDVTRLEYRNGNGIRVQEAQPNLPFFVNVTVGEAQVAEIEVSAVVEPGGDLTAGVIVGRRGDIREDIQTVEQTGNAATTLTVSASLPLD